MKWSNKCEEDNRNMDLVTIKSFMYSFSQFPLNTQNHPECERHWVESPLGALYFLVIIRCSKEKIIFIASKHFENHLNLALL